MDEQELERATIITTSTTARIMDLSTRPEFHQMRLREIGDELGVTRERVRQVLKKLGIKKRRYQARIEEVEAIKERQRVARCAYDKARQSSRRRWKAEHPEYEINDWAKRREARRSLPGHCPTCGYKKRTRKCEISKWAKIREARRDLPGHCPTCGYKKRTKKVAVLVFA